MTAPFRTVAVAFAALLLAPCLFAKDVLDTDLANLWMWKDYKTGRVSSTAPDGSNEDWHVIAPHATDVIAELEGPGMIHHIWVTIATPDPDHLRNIVLRMYWDGEDVPSVECPVGDFFGLGHGEVYDVDSAAIQVGSWKGMNCFWPMPFRKSARITVENQSDMQCDKFYFYVDYRSDIKLPKNVPTFHAWYNQMFPADRAADYIIMEATGTGHYVGTNLSVELNTPGWWGEGDDKIYIDGDTQPTLKGTGSEDYFCGAWCYQKAFNRPYFGTPLMKEGDQHARGAHWNVYRYHILDPITFDKSIQVHIETGVWPGNNDRLPFTNNYASVGYWYQTEPHAPFPPLPAVRKSTLIAWETPADAPVKEGEMMPVTGKSEGVTVEAQSLRQPRLSQGAQAWLKFTGPDQYVELEFNVATAGPYKLEAAMLEAGDYGIAKLSINGQPVESNVDCYRAEGIQRRTLQLGTRQLRNGRNTLRITAMGKNPASTGYLVGLDRLTLAKP